MTKEQLLDIATRLRSESRPTYGSASSNEFAAHRVIPALTLIEASDTIKEMAEHNHWRDLYGGIAAAFNIIRSHVGLPPIDPSLSFPSPNEQAIEICKAIDRMNH